MKNVTKIVVCFVCSMFLILLSSCGGEKAGRPSDSRVKDAIKVLAEHWGENYKVICDGAVEDKYLEITNTKIVNIKDDVEEEAFENVDYTVKLL